MAQITMAELQAKIDSVGKRAPQIVAKATKRGTTALAKEMRRRYLRVLRRRTGDLYDSIKPLFNRRRGRRIKFAAGVGAVKSHSQVYKGSTHEKGGVHQHPGGQPYFFNSAGRIVYVSKRGSLGRELIDRGQVTKPYSITIPSRPFVKPTRKAKLKDVRQMILDELVGEYKKSG